jgi:hypothetical protein
MYTQLGPTGLTGPTALAVQPGTPATTDVLWLDTDDPSATMLPTGGTSGQVLAKINSTDYNTQWSNPTTPAMLPMRSGKYYRPMIAATASVTMSLGNSALFFLPIYVPTSSTFDRIAARTGATVTTAGTARLGIYKDANGIAGSLVLDAGLISFSAINTTYEITISQTLDQGWYWLALGQVTGNTTWFGAGAYSNSWFPTGEMLDNTSVNIYNLTYQVLSNTPNYEFPSTASTNPTRFGYSTPMPFLRKA